MDELEFDNNVAEKSEDSEYFASPQPSISNNLENLEIFKVKNLPSSLVANAIYLVANTEDESGLEVHVADKNGISTRTTLSKTIVQELISLANKQTLEYAQQAAQEADASILELGKEYTTQQVRQAHDNAVEAAKVHTDKVAVTIKLDAIQASNENTDRVANQVRQDAADYADKAENEAIVKANAYTDAKATATLDSASQLAQQFDEKNLREANKYADKVIVQLRNETRSEDQQVLSKLKREIHLVRRYLDEERERGDSSTLKKSNSYTKQTIALAEKRVNQYTHNEIERAIKNVPNALLVVNKYIDILEIATSAERNKSKFVFVKDATGDKTVEKGSASYIYDAEAVKGIDNQKFQDAIKSLVKDPNQNIQEKLKEFSIDNIFYKVAEHESMDVVLSWNDIQEKPSSTIQDIDDTVENFSALPLSILTGFKEVDNELYYKDQPIDRKGGMSYSGELNW